MVGGGKNVVVGPLIGITHMHVKALCTIARSWAKLVVACT